MHDWPGTLGRLGGFAATLCWDDVTPQVRERLGLVLLDTIGVTIAGARTPELRALTGAWDSPAGPATLMGAGRQTTVDAAAWLNGTAACCLELDEGNKYARGHPAAHAFPAVLALGEALEVSGRQLCEALLVGHEVASRFGRAFAGAPGVHPHGHWGVTGAAAAAARLLGADATGIAGAIDAACGLQLATHFDVALQGTFVRNTWIGAANANGLVAARLAMAGLARPAGTAGLTLGTLLGTLDSDALTDALGTRFDVTNGYFKRHASCSYTHPPADAVLELRERHPDLRAEDVVSIEVSTHHLAVPLDGTEFPTRLAAMFSVPYVVAAALTHGACAPTAFDDAHRSDPTVLRLAEATRVSLDPALDARLPVERPARVVLRMADSSSVAAEVPNPIGDADRHPFGHGEVLAKLTDLLGDADADALSGALTALPTAPTIRSLSEAIR
jgi:2-methylcitrate dehydratase PrpD